jgi:lipoprotein-releasing system ATP-binding protein
VIEAKGIHKKYGQLEVLKGINLTINPSEIVSIVGASGAGKTTLLQILGTLDSPDAGQILFEGQDLAAKKKGDLARFRNSEIGFIFQFHQLLPEFTAIENVMMPGLISGRSKSELKERAKSLLERLGLADRLEHKPSELSGGEQQRVAVARAMMNQPKLILADEPSGNLDTENAQALHTLFKELRDEFNLSFVIVTHNLSLAQEGDRVVQMKDGYIISEHSAEA